MTPRAMRRLWREEPPRRSSAAAERLVVNLLRKLSEPERLAVCLHAERLAIARIAKRARRGGAGNAT